MTKVQGGAVIYNWYEMLAMAGIGFYFCTRNRHAPLFTISHPGLEVSL